MDFPETIKIWADTLTDKHECGTEYAFRATIFIGTEGKAVEIWIPDHVDGISRLEFRIVRHCDDLMFLIAVQPIDEEDEESIDPRVFLMVARANEDGTHHCVVWHELWHFSLEKLGLENRTIPLLISAVIHEPVRKEDPYV